MWVLPVELLDEVLHEQRHHRLVGVRLGDAEVYVATLVDGGDHADPGLHLLGLDAVVGSVGPPVHPPEVGHAEPGLIQGDVVLLLEVGAEEAHGPPLTQDQRLLRVALEGDPLDLLIFEAECVHLLIDEAGCDLLSQLPLHLLLNEAAGPDEDFIFDKSQYEPLDRRLKLLLKLLLVDQLSQ